MNTPVNKVTRRTLIPIGLAVTVIGGGSAWLTTLWWTLKAQGQEQDRQGQLLDKQAQGRAEEQKQYFQDIAVIKTDIAVIKTEIKRIKK